MTERGSLVYITPVCKKNRYIFRHKRYTSQVSNINSLRWPLIAPQKDRNYMCKTYVLICWPQENDYFWWRKFLLYIPWENSKRDQIRATKRKTIIAVNLHWEDERSMSGNPCPHLGPGCSPQSPLRTWPSTASHSQTLENTGMTWNRKASLGSLRSPDLIYPYFYL